MMIDKVSGAARPDTLDYEAVFRALPGKNLILSPDLTIVAVTDAYLAATLTDRESILGRPLFEVLPDNPDDPEATGTHNLGRSLQRVLDTGRPDAMPIQKYDIARPARAGGGFEERYWSPLNTPVLSASGDVRYIIHRVEDVTSFLLAERREAELSATSARLEKSEELRRRGEDSLRRQRDLTRLITDNAADAMFLMDSNGFVTFANPAAEQMFGFSEEELLGRRLHDMVHHSRADGSPYPFIECPMGDVITKQNILKHHEDVFFRKDGSQIAVSCSNSPIVTDGITTGAVVVVQDISQRRLAEDRQRLLLSELDHRAKNMLAVVQAVMRLTRADTVAEFRKGLEGRINALARAHALLSTSRWIGADLGRLLEDELAPYPRDMAHITITGPSVRLQPDAAQALAMLFHELATNAAKHGALSVHGGSIAVAWNLGTGGDLDLEWLEQGGPRITDAPVRVGLGTQVIQQSVEAQLHGDIRLDWRAEGLAATMRVPAMHLADPTATVLPRD